MYKVQCPKCGKRVRVTQAGRLYKHKLPRRPFETASKIPYCPWSGKGAPDQAYLVHNGDASLTLRPDRAMFRGLAYYLERDGQMVTRLSMTEVRDMLYTHKLRVEGMDSEVLQRHLRYYRNVAKTNWLPYCPKPVQEKVRWLLGRLTIDLQWPLKVELEAKEMTMSVWFEICNIVAEVVGGILI